MGDNEGKAYVNCVLLAPSRKFMSLPVTPLDSGDEGVAKLK
jgi:hypothetical protein